MRTVRDLMTRDVVTVEAATPIREVARVLAEERLSGLPVVDPEGVVLGVVSETDLVVKTAARVPSHRGPLDRILEATPVASERRTKRVARTAGDAMTAPPITIEPSVPMAQAASIMTARHVNRLPVVEDGKLVGIVTRADLVRAYVRSDEELARTIREDVIRLMLWLDPSPFSVHVIDGVASIRGRVERRSTAEMIESSVAMVPGLVDLDVDVSWSIDDRAVGFPPELAVPFGPR
ncbi:MAG TPA: CBS domain-containing protein [Candidatus Limnocylindrales bacterium]